MWKKPDVGPPLALWLFGALLFGEAEDCGVAGVFGGGFVSYPPNNPPNNPPTP